MKIQPECVPCLLRRIIFETEQSTDDSNLRTKAIQKACNVLSELYDTKTCSAIVATQVHKTVYDTLGDQDPYAELKEISNQVASSLLPKVEETIETSNDPLLSSMICSIIGNRMDFGIQGASSHPSEIQKKFDHFYAEGLGYSDYAKVQKLLTDATSVVLFTDNCGEIVFDKVLCRELKYRNPSMDLTLVVKGKPILSDATLSDAKDLGFSQVVDTILTTGCFAVGVDFSLLPSEVEKVLKKVDIILCKGMANYESFSETSYRPLVYLLRTKCKSIADSMNLSQNINAIKLYS
jgi:hypothetical protein